MTGCWYIAIATVVSTPNTLVKLDRNAINAVPAKPDAKLSTIIAKYSQFELYSLITFPLASSTNLIFIGLVKSGQPLNDVVINVGYPNFFLLTTLIGIPILILVVWVAKLLREHAAEQS
jgi:hypothetical protein